MPAASFAQTNFLGGEVSPATQGRFDLPNYRTFLNVCLNGFPTETGSHTRRPGTRNAGTTRSGAAGRVIKFDFNQATPYQLEFTNGHMRAWAGPQIQYTDQVGVLAISTANPAVAQTAAAVMWATGDQAQFGSLGTTCPLLQARLFTLTKVDTTHFSLADAITGANIDGSTLGVGSLAAAATIARIFDLATPYVGGSWASLRLVQGENLNLPFAMLLQGATAPQMLIAVAAPSAQFGAGFTLNPAVFNDGPYLDPPVNGAQVTPNQLTGNVTLTLGFPTWVATTSYAKGAFVTASSYNYVSLIDQNINHTPPATGGTDANWAGTSAGVAINGGLGFLGTDIGRLVRLYSIPAPWAAGSPYSAGTVISYNPTGSPGAETFWQSQAGGNTGNVPGTDLTHWSPVTTGAAIWTWGKIVSLANQIAAGSGTAFGNMTGNGGVAAAFNGVLAQPASASAALAQSAVAIDGYVGKNYSVFGAQKIGNATYFPSSDLAYAAGAIDPSGGGSGVPVVSITINLRAKATAPASASDGTLLGTASPANTTTAAAVTSNDQSTTWNYVWFEVYVVFARAVGGVNNTIFCGQAQFFNPPGAGSGSAVTLQLLGPPLLYTQPIVTWRLGAYSNTTGWPTCGCYSDGRIWLSGAIANRFDACVANGISGNAVNFAPTDQNGVVSAANAISYPINSDTVNPIFWLSPDLQGIIVGTQAGEFVIQAPTAGGISPFNVTARRTTNAGCANVEPRQTEHTKIFVQRYGRKIIEAFADVFSGKYTAPNLAEKAMHLTRKGILELAYQQAVTPIIWARDTVGTLLGITYKRDTLMTSQGPTFAGWHRHALGSGRVVESIAAGPSVGGNLDALTMVTNDAATGIRHVEIMTDMFDENAAFTDAWFLDDATAGTSWSSSSVTPAPLGGLTINGLWHLNGKTVQAWVGGIDCGLQEGGTISDFVVTNGSITIPYGDGISAGSGAGKFTAALVASFSTLPIVVGFTYNTDTQLVRPMTPQESGARTGPALGKKRRIEQYAMLLNNAGMGLGTVAGAGVLVGADFAKLAPALFKQFQGSSINIASNLAFSGVHWDTLRTESDFDNMFCWRVTRPYPCNVAAVELFLDTKDK